MSNENIAIVWFRQDLRLMDNPALTAAVESGAAILPVYVLDDVNAGDWKMGGASRFWAHHSLDSLNKDLDRQLVFSKGDAAELILALAKKVNAKAVYWNRCYEPWRIKRDTVIKQSLEDIEIEATSFNGSLLWEPWDVVKKDGTPYKVFTPFFKRGCYGQPKPRQPLPKPDKIKYASIQEGLTLDELALLPAKPEPRWDSMLEPHWTIGEQGAQQALDDFLDDGLQNYKVGRDFMTEEHASHLSPRLHIGEVSPNQVWYAANLRGHSEHWNTDLEHFLSELGWREFSYNLLYHFPDLPYKGLQPRFDNFGWAQGNETLAAWQKGQTGYPIVDAAMRELWQTGYMHNRARMIVGSFLVKHLLLPWQQGEAWFWDCLCDADLASNAFNWQWIAGCGADAAPYFRIFNPVTQGEKFDADGAYVRHYVPELAKMPDKYIHHPWDAPDDVLRAAGIKLGRDYPRPVVDHSAARQRALEAFAKTKSTV